MNVEVMKNEGRKIDMKVGRIKINVVRIVLKVGMQEGSMKAGRIYKRQKKLLSSYESRKDIKKGRKDCLEGRKDWNEQGGIYEGRND